MHLQIFYPLLLLCTSACITCARQISCSGNQCDVNPDNCLYGATLIQSEWICSKGPGEKCGGELNQWGICGDGLTCNSSNRCAGCSVRSLLKGTLECSTGKDLRNLLSNDTLNERK